MTVNTQRLGYYIAQAGFSLPTQIRKRNGDVVSFDVARIEEAVSKCYIDTYYEAVEDKNRGRSPVVEPSIIAENAVRAVSVRFSEEIPTVEAVQDAVEFALLSAGDFEAAKHYILYRNQHSETRKTREVPADVKAAFDADLDIFTEPSQRFNFYDKYSAYNWDLGRRETWHETVDRTVDHLRWEVEQHKPGAISDDVFDRIHDGILRQRVMPSMRLLAMAGPAARRNSMSLYNCSYLPVKDIESFVETLLISMAGCGVGFSVEREYVENFPRVKRQKKNQDVDIHVVEDSAEGWATALRTGLQAWWGGLDVQFDFTQVRPAGAPLKTKGGRASGPGPLEDMLAFMRSTILARQGTFIRTIDALDLECAVGEAAVQGGVRRTAMICLFDWDDREVRTAKDGPWGSWPKIRSNSNNSAVWPEDVTDVDIMGQMLDMIKAKSGEPGIFSRTNANKTKPKRRKRAQFGTNPCGEILLRPFEFCNLSQAVSRPGDTIEDLRDKTELATIIGTIQSLSTRFPGLRDEWKQNCEEERLLGVDLTAQVDCEILRPGAENGDQIRRELVELTIAVNNEYAGKLDINPSVANTCNKPAGNSGEFLNAANGIHRRQAEFYERRMIVGANTPLFKVLRSAGAPMEPQAGSTAEEATKWVVTFPKKSPEGAPVKGDASAVEQCEFWLLNKENWTEHNPSCTITYREDEAIDLVAWVVKNKDKIGGLSFFPVFDAIYPQAPFQEIDEERYNELVAAFPHIDYSAIYGYELEDMTTAAQELACFAGVCET